MPTCNLSKIMHNIWFQQLGKSGACMYTMTSNDYVRAFKQSTLYYLLRKVAHQGKSLIYMNFSCVNQPNLMI
jgi:hypothetical protein